MMRNPLSSPAFGTLSRLRERVVVLPFTFVRTGNGGVNSTFALANSGLPTFGVAVGNHSASPLRGHLSHQRGFTLVEMIVVMVITGILGGIVAMFIRAPMQGYVDSARRAEMTDIADTALRRITRDLRLALPNSVRVTVVGGNTYLEFLPTSGGGRYRAEAAPSGVSAGCTSLALDVLDFTAADTCFEVLGAMPPAFVGGESVVVYNLGIAGASAYDNTSRTTTAVTAAGNIINIAAPGKLFPFDSPGHRFQVITTPVTYVCAPVAGGVGGTLTRYWGYAIQATQPIDTTVAPLSTASHALLATNVSACSFVYDTNVVAQRSGLVTMRLTITESGETVTLYSAVHVSNVP